MITIKNFIQDNQRLISIEIEISKYVFRIYNYNIIIYPNGKYDGKDIVKYEKLKKYKFLFGKVLYKSRIMAVLSSYNEEGIDPFRIKEIKLFNKKVLQPSLEDLTEK